MGSGMILFPVRAMLALSNYRTYSKHLQGRRMRATNIDGKHATAQKTWASFFGREKNSWTSCPEHRQHVQALTTNVALSWYAVQT